MFTSAPQNSYSGKSFKSHREITVMEFFFSKVAGCYLTKKGLHHSFFRLNFVKFFRLSKLSLDEYFCSFYAFVRFYQCFERSHSISLSKFWQFSFHSSITTIIIWLTKQIPYMQLFRAVL